MNIPKYTNVPKAVIVVSQDAVQRTSLGAIADWISDFDPSGISAATREHARLLLLDSIGCAAAGQYETVVSGIRAYLPDSGGPHVVIGGGTASLPDAILINGSLIRAQDLNDLYMGPGMVGHPSDNIAALIAVAEREGVGGARLLDAIVLCYELYCRELDITPDASPFDHTSASGLAVPAAIAWMLEYSRDETINAIALSTTFTMASAEIRRGQISSAKSIANAVVSSAATAMALLARGGLTGPSGAVDGDAGWFATVLCGGSVESLVAPLDREHIISSVAIKAYPAIGTAQGAVAAAALSSARFSEDPTAVSSIELLLPESPLVSGQIADRSRWKPATKESADHSIPYLVAIALSEGTVSHAQFERRMWEDKGVQTIMSKLSLAVDNDLKAVGKMAARMGFRMADGSSWSSEVSAPLGHPRNRMTRDQVIERFIDCSHIIWSEERMRRIISAVEEIDSLSSAEGLTQLLGRESFRS